MGDLGLSQAFGADATAQRLRQQIMDRLQQQQAAQQMDIQGRSIALREQEAQRSAEEFKMTQAERQRESDAKMSAAKVGDATKLAPQLPMDQNVAPEAASILKSGGMGGQLYTPPTMGENVNGPAFDPTKANPAMNLGTPVQQKDAADSSAISGIANDPNTSPALRGFLRVRGALPKGENIPYQLITEPNGPKKNPDIKDTSQGLMDVGDGTGKPVLGPDGKPLMGYHPAPGGGNADRSRLDKSYDTQTKRLDTIEKPLSDQAERIGRLRATMNANSPQADTLIAPEILTVAAGGAGSGLRMNEAEIARIIGGRTQWESLKARLSAWQSDPSQPFSITPEQRKQMHSLVQAIAERGQKRLALIDEARAKMVDAPDVTAHRQILNEVSKHLNDEALGGGGGGGDVPTRIRYDINGNKLP